MSKLIKVDLHCHTYSSYDSLTTIEQIEKVLKSGKVDKIAITDHSVIGAAFELQKKFGSKIIIGEEIKTQEGEIIGLFLQKQIPQGLTAQATINEILKQRGVIYFPHPFDKRRSGIAKSVNFESLLKQGHLIEGFNSRCFSQKANQLATEFGLANGILIGVGSDGHFYKEIGNSYLEMEDFDNASEFLQKAKTAKLHGKKTSFLYFMVPTLSKWIKILRK